MKLTLSLIAITFAGNLFAQTTKITEDRKEKGIKETYYVLKANKSIREGLYSAYSRYGGKLICEGVYKNNMRDSVWTSYNYDGKLEVKYDYTQKKLLEYNSPKYLTDQGGYNVINGTDTLKTKMDQPPIFIDGMAKMSQLFVTNIRYPLKAKEGNIQGKVVIAITIDSLGHVSNYRIKTPVGGGCSEEALRVIKMTDGDWLPGLLNGRAVTAEYDIPVSFTLQQG